MSVKKYKKLTLPKCFIFTSECTKMRLAAGLRPDLLGVLTTPPRRLAGFKGCRGCDPEGGNWTEVGETERDTGEGKGERKEGREGRDDSNSWMHHWLLLLAPLMMNCRQRRDDRHDASRRLQSKIRTRAPTMKALRQQLYLFATTNPQFTPLGSNSHNASDREVRRDFDAVQSPLRRQ